jgi:hypothetical protein
MTPRQSSKSPHESKALIFLNKRPTAPTKLFTEVGGCHVIVYTTAANPWCQIPSGKALIYY